MSMDLAARISQYQPSAYTVDVVRSSKLLLVAGIVGGGKNTVINELIKDNKYHLIVSHTTRPPRANHGIMERDGVDYHFVGLDTVNSMIDAREFIEAKYVHGNVYGTSVTELEGARKQNKIAVTDIDIQGVMEYLQMKPDTHAIFLLPPSVETWLARLERRYGDLTNHQDEIKKRFATAYEEITHIMQDPRFIMVINDDLDTTVSRIEQIVAGERSETSDYALSIAEHLLEYIASKQH